MKKLFTLFFLTISASLTANAQNGLEQIIVEKYYVSDANDTAANLDGGVLPVGSTTYRIYADMLPYYKFQAAYGVPGHDLIIQTSTLFFNNEDRGNTTPSFSKTLAAKNTVMLDSWLSVGAACNGNYGVLKSLDNGVSNIVNNYTPQVLQNNDPAAGIPLTVQDGFLAGTPEPVTTVGISNEIEVFNNQNDGTNGPLFFTNNGSWASLNGSIGPDSVDNKVLIAQITTNGTFSFELNIQIGTPTGGVENYVARNPVAAEVSIPSLIFSSTTGLTEHTATTNQVGVYPNPAHGMVFVHGFTTATDVHIGIYSVSGQLEQQNELADIAAGSSASIDISALSPGLYILQTVSAEGTSAQRFVIQ